MTLILHSRKLIFLRTRKTASTSLEYALLPFLDRKDFVSTSSGWNPDGHPWWRTTHQATDNPREQEWKEFLLGVGALRFSIYKHEPAAGVRTAVGNRVWRSYFKLSVERHPYDRLISMWQWRYRDRPEKPSLPHFVRFLEKVKASDDQWRGRGTKWQLYSNWPIYTIDDRVVADHVIRWENLEDELAAILPEFGIEGVELGDHKRRFRDPSATPEALLTPALKARVSKLYRPEFTTFGYEPWDVPDA